MATTKKQHDLNQMELVLQLMKREGVYKFSLGDLHVEFGIITGTSNKVETVDDAEERAARIREVLKEAISDEEANLNWSV